MTTVGSQLAQDTMQAEGRRQIIRRAQLERGGIRAPNHLPITNLLSSVPDHAHHADEEKPQFRAPSGWQRTSTPRRRAQPTLRRCGGPRCHLLPSPRGIPVTFRAKMSTSALSIILSLLSDTAAPFAHLSIEPAHQHLAVPFSCFHLRPGGRIPLNWLAHHSRIPVACSYCALIASLKLAVDLCAGPFSRGPFHSSVSRENLS